MAVRARLTDKHIVSVKDGVRSTKPKKERIDRSKTGCAPMSYLRRRKSSLRRDAEETETGFMVTQRWESKQILRESGISELKSNSSPFTTRIFDSGGCRGHRITSARCSRSSRARNSYTHAVSGRGRAPVSIPDVHETGSSGVRFRVNR